MEPGRVFLTAEWRRLAMLSYEVDRELLLKFVPRGTELDAWNGRVFVSLVGFRFLKTRVLGLPIPFHTNFDEVNLRFYVRRQEGHEVRRGVVFIREIVPRRAIALVARNLYNENYVALPMTHEIADGQSAPAVSYGWRTSCGWSAMTLEAEGNPQVTNAGSEQEFITQHYWGYAAQRDGGTVEYRVTYPSWRVWTARRAEFVGEVEELYGCELAEVLRGTPASAFLAEGSPVAVMRGRRL
ncbi:MAG TPA: DUF2071 domain-containing protein [Terriglobales bacterium]|nr:DUF2071 domain-containing protein [Terriglobales bacterium]